MVTLGIISAAKYKISIHSWVFTESKSDMLINKQTLLTVHLTIQNHNFANIISYMVHQHMLLEASVINKGWETLAISSLLIMTLIFCMATMNYSVEKMGLSQAEQNCMICVHLFSWLYCTVRRVPKMLEKSGHFCQDQKSDPFTDI